MHEEDYEGLAFGVEWSAVFHPKLWNPFIVAYSRKVGGLRQTGSDSVNK